MYIPLVTWICAFPEVRDSLEHITGLLCDVPLASIHKKALKEKAGNLACVWESPGCRRRCSTVAVCQTCCSLFWTCFKQKACGLGFRATMDHSHPTCLKMACKKLGWQTGIGKSCWKMVRQNSHLAIGQCTTPLRG